MTGINSDIIGETTLEIILYELNQIKNKSIIFDINDGGGDDDDKEIKSTSKLETVLGRISKKDADALAYDNYFIPFSCSPQTIGIIFLLDNFR